ncbi:recombinase family protein [Salmonella enterica]|nr:recombinase family protein [Salmonella enterica]
MRFGYALKCVDDHDLQLQLKALKAAGCTDIFTDTIDHINGSRPAFRLLLSKLSRGDVLIVWRLDKFALSVYDLNLQISRLYRIGVEFVSLQEAIDTDSSAAPLLLNLFSAMAEFERNIKSRPRPTGRKPTMTHDKLAAAQKLIADRVSVTEAAKIIGVSRATLYRALKP